jgi:hypothetical protein
MVAAIGGALSLLLLVAYAATGYTEALLGFLSMVLIVPVGLVMDDGQSHWRLICVLGMSLAAAVLVIATSAALGAIVLTGEVRSPWVDAAVALVVLVWLGFLYWLRRRRGSLT